MMMPAKKQGYMLTMDDDDGTGGAGKAVSKKARAKVRGPNTGNAQ